MKLLITESKLKKFIEDKFGFDFTGDIEKITSVHDIPIYFKECFSGVYLNWRINKNGPMFLIKIDDYFYILYQKSLSSESSDIIITSECHTPSEQEFMNLLGIQVLGLSIEDFINLYISL
jgi:hypothetical protein